LWGNKVRPELLAQEDLDCLRDWENYVLLDRLPHELGYAPEPYHEDIEAIKTMKKWMDQRQEKERKKEEMKRRVQEKVKGMRAKN
jgi:hypothetical protein